MPCRGQPFEFEAEYDMELNAGFVRLIDYYNNLRLSGNTVAPKAPYRGTSSGRMKVWLTTGAYNPSRGLVSLRAWCPQKW